jgi:hypothetical protein
MASQSPFTEFKAVIQTDGRYGRIQQWSQRPIDLLKQAIILALLCTPVDEVDLLYRQTATRLRDSLSRKRRRAGDVVQLVEVAGFGGTPGKYRIVRDGADPCMLCDNPECQEWPNLERLAADGSTTGERAYHVPECQMSDV